MLRTKDIIGVTVCTVIIFFFLHLFKGLFAGEEGRIKQFIHEGQRAVESRNILKCSDLISKDYRDAYGNDRSTLIYAVRETFAYYERFKIIIEDMHIQLQEEQQKAEVEIAALIIGQTTNKEEESIFEGEKGRLKIDIVKEEGRWKLLTLEFYEPVKIMDRYIS